MENQKRKIILAFLGRMLADFDPVTNRAPFEVIIKLSKIAEAMLDCSREAKTLPLIAEKRDLFLQCRSIAHVPLSTERGQIASAANILVYPEFPEWFKCGDAIDVFNVLPEKMQSGVAFMNYLNRKILLTLGGGFESMKLWYAYWTFQLISKVADGECKEFDLQNLSGMGIDDMIGQLRLAESIP